MLKNIVPSLCTTNSIIASYMLLSEKKNFNFFLTLNKKLCIKMEPNEKNSNCVICSKDWIIINLKKNSNYYDFFMFINKQLNYDCKSISNEDGFYFSKLTNNLNEIINIKTNTICTLEIRNNILVKLYINKYTLEFEIIEKV